MHIYLRKDTGETQLCQCLAAFMTVRQYQSMYNYKHLDRSRDTACGELRRSLRVLLVYSKPLVVSMGYLNLGPASKGYDARFRRLSRNRCTLGASQPLLQHYVIQHPPRNHDKPAGQFSRFKDLGMRYADLIT